MSDLEIYLRWISRIRLVCGLGLVASIVIGIMSLMGSFGPDWSIVTGVASAVVFVATLVGLNAMSYRVFEVEESFHRNNFDSATAILNSIHSK